jgi:hypothetical protein
MVKMTIQFYCPKCDTIIAFDRKHCGKRAKCTTCGQLFIIPFKDFEKPEKIELKTKRTAPLPGFYRAALVDSWKLFTDRDNTTTMVFVLAAVFFKFLSGDQVCYNYISFIVVWGWLLGFYMNIIYETAFEIDKLPKIYLGTSITFLWYIIKPILIFLWTLAVVELPYFIALGMQENTNHANDNIRQMGIVPMLLSIFGLFLFPVAILTVSVSKDILLLRPDYLFKPIFRAFGPYLVVVTLLVAAGAIEMQTRSFTGDNLAIDTIYLLLDLATQLIAILAMRAIGLFYRHYGCYFAW